MAAKPLPDQVLLLKLLRYEPETGRLFWLPRTPDLFKDGGIGRDAMCRAWNARNAGREAFPCTAPKGARGYVQAQIFKRKYLKHRIIWKLVTGDEPDQIDHINGDKADNRFANLRSVTCAENMRNLARHSHNKSGCTGVFWNDQFDRWQAHITVGGHTRHLGLHRNKDAAIRARKAAERRLGFHPNHGRQRKERK